MLQQPVKRHIQYFSASGYKVLPGLKFEEDKLKGLFANFYKLLSIFAMYSFSWQLLESIYFKTNMTNKSRNGISCVLCFHEKSNFIK